MDIGGNTESKEQSFGFAGESAGALGPFSTSASGENAYTVSTEFNTAAYRGRTKSTAAGFTLTDEVRFLSLISNL
jgi:hypothetical protein